ncbi:MAG: hypothetical protein PHV11_10070, partial [Candidatus Bipolaricaulis sp.]|nr:hypothetical protein [Candidatus Bipolaricaulis sp.]
GNSTAILYSDDMNVRSTVVGKAELDHDTAGTAVDDIESIVTLTAVIPAGFYYACMEESTARGDDPTLVEWIEWGGIGTEVPGQD